MREAVLTNNDELEGNASTLSNATFENDAGDHIFSVSWASVLGNNATNELKVGHVRESLLQGPRVFFDDDWKFIGLNGREQFDIGPQNSHPDYNAGTRNNYNEDLIRSITVDDSFTYIKSGGAAIIRSRWAVPGEASAPSPASAGTSPACTRSRPTRRSTRRMRARIPGDSRFGWARSTSSRRTGGQLLRSGQVADQPEPHAAARHALRLSGPHARGEEAFPTLGVAYDLTGDGKTLLRGGVGEFYNLQPIAIVATLLSSAVIGPAFVYDSGQVTSPATTGVVPSGVCLQPLGNGGLSNISPACRTFLGERARVEAGGYVNDQPTVDGPRRLPYLWSFSTGVKRELFRDLALSVDYVGNRGRDQIGTIDINEGPVGANGRTITRLGADVFDPDGEVIPAAARNTAFRRVLQYQSIEALDTDYDSLELAFEKRMSNRWSGRVSYTLSRARDVGAITDDRNPRGDYGRTSFDNRHGFAMSANAEIWRGLGAGMVFRYYSGYPINETIGSDYNGDGDTNDRPIAGVHDASSPILSALDSTGRAIRNGIDGEKQVLLDGRFQYVWRIQRYQAGVFFEFYNLTNQVNFGNPTGNRNSTNFMIPVTAGDLRTTQIGFRLTF